jgi:hypothetical protein
MAQIALQVGAAGSLNTENDVRAVIAIEPQAVAAPLNGAGVDLQGYEAASVVLNVGVCTDGEYAVTVEHSDDNGVGDAYAAVTALDAAFTQITTTADQTIEVRRLRTPNSATPGLKRWVRMVVAEPVGGVTGCVMSAAVILGAKRSSVGDNVA